MNYPVDTIKIEASRKAISWQGLELYSGALRAGVINFQDIYHLTLFDVIGSRILREKIHANALGTEREKDPAIELQTQTLVAIIQDTTPNDAYEKLVDINIRITTYHNAKLIKLPINK